MWDIPLEGYSWATAGYMGAINSGQTVCGLLVGSSIAIGLKLSRGMEGIPENHKDQRERAIQAVEELYKGFIKEFGSTNCKTLSKCDWSNPEALTRWIQDKGWKSTCDVFLKFTMNKCVQMAKDGKV